MLPAICSDNTPGPDGGLNVYLVQDAATSSDPIAIERRRGLRISEQRPVKVFEPLTARYFAGITGDISTAGLKVQLRGGVPIRPGKVVHVHVGAKENGLSLVNHRQMMPARVIWMKREPNSAQLIAGLEFIASIAAHLDAA